MKGPALTMVVLLAASAAFAQDATKNGQVQQEGEQSMGRLLSQGYEIRAAVPNGGKFVVFMQKDQSAYACEFQSLVNSRCGAIN
ncbi:hypothetical protein [Rhizobium sp. BK251]|uniref:hypothetical protein n=1 Tax=Rhizobium sp. BK251 TaxID=2512125 RepID=UPI00104EC03C|nr:hypothetical protein [Rhizobium sp. BK251]TCL70414.1 hypothetical protein EV286_107288 [Rhizobium sp. BK251]